MALSVVSFLFSWCSTGGLGLTLLGDGFLYCILSASSPDLSSLGPQAPSALCSFPYHIPTPLELEPSGRNSTRTRTQLSTTLARRTQLNYIIVRRPLDLWNRMFNRHQAEITVMQLTGHSLPVHHSVVYHGIFLSSSHFISQFPPPWFPLMTTIRMCHLLPVHHLEWHFWPGQKVKT